jgi:DNA mismatch endonuclease (patch repair protein)
MPKTNRAYWMSKIRRNIARDAAHLLTLKADGWEVLVIWECELKNEIGVKARLKNFLG